MWKRENLINLPEKERIEKTKTMIHLDDLNHETIYKLKEHGLGKYIGYVNGQADIWLYPEEWEQIKLSF